MKHDLSEWHNLKSQLINTDKIPTFKNREIWWCSIGLNVGHEQNGKGNSYNRPVLIVKKFNNRLFWGVPLTTQIKNNPHYYHFTFNDKNQCAMLTQLRLWDVARLNRKMGRLPNNDYNTICKLLKSYF